MKQNDAQLLT